MANTGEHFEAILCSEGEAARERTPVGRARLGIVAICAVLALGTLLTLIGGANNATIVLQGASTIKAEQQLQAMIDDNNAQIEPLKNDVDDLLEQRQYDMLAAKLIKLKLLVDQNARNEELRKKVDQAQSDLLDGKYPTVDIAIDSIILNKCNATTMTQIAQLKIDAMNATDNRDLDRVSSDLGEIKLLWPTCVGYMQDNATTENTAEAPISARRV